MSGTTILSAEELSKLSPAELLAYVASLTASIKAAGSLVSEAKGKQTEQARRELEASLRAELIFPSLGADVLAKVKAAGGAGFVVVYNLESGAGTPSVTYHKRAAQAGPRQPKGPGDVSVVKAEARDLKGDYAANTTEEERAEDDIAIEERVTKAMAAGNFKDPATGVPNHTKAENSLGWAMRTRRLHNKGVAGY